jgi:hypothetical protein
MAATHNRCVPGCGRCGITHPWQWTAEYVPERRAVDAQARVSLTAHCDGCLPRIVFRKRLGTQRNGLADAPAYAASEVRAHPEASCGSTAPYTRLLRSGGLKHVTCSSPDTATGGALADHRGRSVAERVHATWSPSARANNTYGRARACGAYRSCASRSVTSCHYPMRLMGYSHVPGDWLLLQPTRPAGDGLRRTSCRTLAQGRVVYWPPRLWHLRPVTSYLSPDVCPHQQHKRPRHSLKQRHRPAPTDTAPDPTQVRPTPTRVSCISSLESLSQKQTWLRELDFESRCRCVDHLFF